MHYELERSCDLGEDTADGVYVPDVDVQRAEVL
jgi:hypothetical protein